MSNILLIEPDYKSKFPPLGLMKLSTLHKEKGDSVTFARGRVEYLKNISWHRIYISTLFTYELPRAVKTIKYYSSSVAKPSDIIVGGIGATLMPEFIRKNVDCTIIEGLLDKPNIIAPNTPSVSQLTPDYSILDSVEWRYAPEDSYFCKVTNGCIRKCKFCAVPKLEPEFSYSKSVRKQVEEIKERFGEKQNIVLLDNNILATSNFKSVIDDLRKEGFERGSTRNGRKRSVDFNQGIDARLITKNVAEQLSSICMDPVRLAFDYDAMEKAYVRAIDLLSQQGQKEFTNYIMFNFNDTPQSLYRRLRINVELSDKNDIRVTGYPMRYVPIRDVRKQHIAKRWRWRYLRGIQCILLATHGVVSPNQEFFEAAFGRSYDEFIEIISMPDRYIIKRNQYKDNEAREWRKLYAKLSESEKEEILQILEDLNRSRTRLADMKKNKKYLELLQHYYPDGQSPKWNG